MDDGIYDGVVLTEQERIAHALNDSVIQPLFAASLGLHSALAQEAYDDRMHGPLRAAIGELDGAIRAVREAVFDFEIPLAAAGRDVTNGA